MSEIIEFAHAVSGTKAPENVRDMKDGAALREDAVMPSLPPCEVLKNAHERSDGFFLARGKELTTEE